MSCQPGPTGDRVVVLTTTGRKSGLPRESELVGIPFEDALAVIGTNYGQAATPAWALNLGYAKYLGRISGRHVRIFVLNPP